MTQMPNTLGACSYKIPVIVQIALQQKATIATCNPHSLKNHLNTLFYKGFKLSKSWHKDCSNHGSVAPIPSEMPAMNSTLLVLNTLALAVLLVSHFQSESAIAEQSAEVAGSYHKPLKPLPQLAIMTSANSIAPQQTTELPPANEHARDKRWVF